ncbi:MAG: hypothetical protein A2X64_08195 [Ignavibacteria bacterium GWF2_33_9]|nr:MAG: hypothetical protein A2X64_08195 [Ignavibacteria bacterium GWF2_33_9]
MVVFADQNIPYLREALDGKVDVRIAGKNEFSKENLIKNNVKALFIRSTVKVFRELVEGTPVEFIATATSGTDHIDTEYLDSISLSYFSAPGSNANSVAEFVIFSILKWNLLTEYDLSQNKIGIIGFGNIGKLVAQYSYLMGFKVLVNDPPLEKEGYVYPDYVTRASLDKIFESCDVITNHVPLTYTGEFPTFHLINEVLLSKIKQDSLFIHTSRGGVVAEEALTSLLEENRIHLSIDVWEHEPIFNSYLAKNALLALPHLSGYSYDGKLKGALTCLNHFKNHFGIDPETSFIEKLIEDNRRVKLNFQAPISIFKLLRSRRFFETDVHSFLEFVDMQDDEKEKAFLELRRNYPKRRETLYCDFL